MKLTIINNESQEPVLTLMQDQRGLSVVGGDSKLVKALGLDKFNTLEEIQNYINQDPNKTFTAQMDEEEQSSQSGEVDDTDSRLEPALKILRDLKDRVKDRQEDSKAKKDAEKPEAKLMEMTDSEIMKVPGGFIYISISADGI